MASIGYLNNINLNGNQIENVLLQSLGTEPTSYASQGRIFFDSANKGIKYHDGTGWKLLTPNAAPSLTVTGGTSAGPKIKITTEGGSDEVTLPSASANQSGVVTTASQGFGGLKTFTGNLIVNSKVYFGSTSNYLELIDGKLHTNLAFYSDSSVSAGGLGTGGSGAGGGAGVSLLQGWNEDNNDSEGNEKALGAVLAKSLESRVSSLEGGSATTITQSGSGNAVTSVTKSGSTITVTKGSTFLTGITKAQVEAVLTGGITTHNHAWSNITGKPNLLTLGSDNKIPLTNIPDAILGQVLYGGTVAANAVATLSTNAKKKLEVTADTQTLTNDTTAKTGYGSNEGIYYIASASLSFAGLSLQVGDWLISTGTAWKKIDNTDAVTGVKGGNEQTYRIGNVNITCANIGAAQSGHKHAWADITSGVPSIVNTIGGKSGAVTLRGGQTANGSVNLTITSDGEIQASLVGYKSGTVTSVGLAVPTGLSVSGSPITSSGTLTLSYASGYSIPTTAKQAQWDKAYAAMGHSYGISGSSLTSYTTTTNFASQNLIATLYDSSNNVVFTDMAIVTANNKYNVKVTFAGAIGSNTYRLVVIGI